MELDERRCSFCIINNHAVVYSTACSSRVHTGTSVCFENVGMALHRLFVNLYGICYNLVWLVLNCNLIIVLMNNVGDRVLS